MSKRYEEARSDFEYLESIAKLEDQVELDSDREALMRNPTKSQAASMYEAGIRLWFFENRRKGNLPAQAKKIESKYF